MSKGSNDNSICDNSRFHTIKDLMVIFKLSRQKIHTMTLTGELPQPYRFGRSIRYLRHDIEGYIESHKPKPLKLPHKPS